MARDQRGSNSSSSRIIPVRTATCYLRGTQPSFEAELIAWSRKSLL